MIKILKHILLESSGELLELYLATFSLIWGLWVLLPWSSFTTSTHAFMLLESIAPEWTWGGAIAGLGAIKAIAVLQNRVTLKKTTLILSLFLWLCVALSFAFGLPTSVGLPVYVLTAFANFFCLWRNGR